MNTKYKHIRFSDYLIFTGGALTIAYNEGTNGIEYGVSYCSKKDQFCRKTGRELAESRLNSAEGMFVPYSTKGNNVILKILLDIASFELYPESLKIPFNEVVAYHLQYG